MPSDRPRPAGRRPIAGREASGNTTGSSRAFPMPEGLLAASLGIPEERAGSRVFGGARSVSAVLATVLSSFDWSAKIWPKITRVTRSLTARRLRQVVNAEEQRALATRRALITKDRHKGNTLC